MRTTTMIVTVAVVLLGSFAAAQDVSYDYSKTADFSQFKTYAWARGNPVQDELTHKRIVSAIDAQLAAKGLVKVSASENPDVLVSYDTTFDRDVRVSGFSAGWQGIRWGSGSARAEHVVVGMLVVNIADADSGAMVWRGMASRDVDAKASPEKRDKNINKAAEKIFRNYPPKA